MRIDSAILGMDSARSYRAASYSYRRFELKDYSGVGSNPGNDTKGGLLSDADSKEATKTEESRGDNRFFTLDGMESLQEKISRIQHNYRVRNDASTDMDAIRHETIRYIMDLLFGRAREKFRRWSEENLSPSVGKNTGIGTYNTDNTTQNINDLFVDREKSNGQPVDFSVVKFRSFAYTQAEYRYESEDTTFSARGTVKTADGREIPFNIDISMSREFESYYEEQSSLSVGVRDYLQMCDPLVINLNSNIASVSDQKIRFDIDGDGELDTIGQLAQGSGYLALDKNNDGKINDGNELFGAKSGDGFADLAEYDSDGNGWIDENDPVWNKLKIMTYDSDGNEKLITLAKAGVGAISLSRLATDFSQTDNRNRVQSAIRSTGIFLYENGMAGTVQHLDVAKYKQEA